MTVYRVRDAMLYGGVVSWQMCNRPLRSSYVFARSDIVECVVTSNYSIHFNMYMFQLASPDLDPPGIPVVAKGVAPRMADSGVEKSWLLLIVCLGVLVEDLR